jgi:hypothetical protein
VVTASESVAWVRAERGASRHGLLNCAPRNAMRGTAASKRGWNECRAQSAGVRDLPFSP